MRDPMTSGKKRRGPVNSGLARTIADLPERFNAAEDILAHNLSVRPNKVAIIDHLGSCTYAGLADRIDRMAGSWQNLGVAAGDRVLLCLLDTRDFPTVFLGAIKAGVVPVPLNTLLTADDYKWILKDSGAKAVFVSLELADRWTGIAVTHPHIQFVSSEGGPWNDLEGMLHSTPPHTQPADTARDDTAFWLYTSGSTGRPKGAMHRHSAMRLTANLYGIGTAGFSEDDVILSVAKQFFAYGLGNALIFPFAVGAIAVLHKERATPGSITDLLVTHNVTILGGVPTFFAGWLASPLPSLPHLRIALSAGEALPAHLGEAFRAQFGADILDGLGSTEMLHIFLSQRPGAVRYGCTGRPVEGYDIRIVNEMGQEAAPGEIGDLHVSGPTSASSYWQNPEKSVATFQGVWTVTGDKYSQDADGWCTYAGRGDDMLKVGGIYVSPIEVEEALASHSAVLEAAVIGTPDDDQLIKPKAFVVLGQGLKGDATIEASLKAHVKSLLAPYKYPRWISFVEVLPKTATGKIQRYRLREGK
jgi:benzoate-CoA ligase